LPDFFSDGGPCPEDIGFEQQLRANGIENGLRRGGDALGFKIIVHYQEKVDVFWDRFGGYDAAPDKDAAQLAGARCEFHQRLKAAKKPQSPRRARAKPRLEFLPIRHVDSDRQIAFRSELRQHETTISERRAWTGKRAPQPHSVLINQFQEAQAPNPREPAGRGFY